MSGDALPTTLAAWERALVDHFLRLGECGDASPLRSFEITGETLVAVFPDAAATAGQAEEAFRTAVRTDPRVFDAFRSGTPRIAGTTRPECFAYLCASLLIDTLLDGAYSGQGQFRERLKIWLGTSRTMMQLPGIASMWHDLEHWLEARLAAGEPFRRLVLPDPRSWTQIGHTRRLSFPTRSDVRFLEKALANFPRGASDPPGLIRAIEAAIARDGASWGMESAFAEFRDAFRGGGASTGHRFWRLVLRAANNRSAGDGPSDVSLRIEFDEDGRAGLRLDGSPVVTLAAAMRAIPVVRSGNLAAAAQRGVVFFRQTGMASWAAESDPPPGRVHVGVAPTHAAVARGTNATFALSGDWLLTAAPVPPGTVDDLLARLRLSRLRRERLIDVSVEGGVSTGSGMLGRRRFLPRIVAAGRASAVREVVERGLSPPSARCDGGQIAADADLDGSYELSVSSGTSGDAPEWTRRVRFHRDAAPHGELGRAAEREPAVAEWLVDQVEGEGALPSPTVLPPIVWEGGPCGVGDLLEAVYASGRSGLGDAEIIDLVSRAGAPASAWEVLRAIQESGFVAARHRARWRGRCWTLEPVLLGATAWGTLVEGATCAALQEEFRQVAVGAGGAPFRVRPLSAWAPPIIGAVGVDPLAISGALGWPVREGTSSSAAAGRLEISELVAADHVRASSWDWTRRRFVVGIASEGPVEIERWAHPGGRDHDQYRVRWTGGETRHATRTAAIAQGHSIAGIPFLEVRDGLLVRTSAEGALPFELARRLRAAALSCAGPADGGGYTYPVDVATLRAFADALPGSLAGLPETAAVAPGAAGGTPLTRPRRDGGRTRLRWHAGRVLAA